MIFDSTRDYTPPGRTPQTRLSGREKTKLLVGTLVATAVGSAMSRYFGGAAFVPGIALIVVFLIASAAKCRSGRFFHAVALQLAHISWMTLGAVLSRNFLYFLDPIVLGAGVTWLILRPGRAPVVFLGTLNLLDAGYNVFRILTISDPPFERLLQLHLLLQVGIVAALLYGVFRRQPVSPAVAEPARPEELTPSA